MTASAIPTPSNCLEAYKKLLDAFQQVDKNKCHLNTYIDASIAPIERCESSSKKNLKKPNPSTILHIFLLAMESYYASFNPHDCEVFRQRQGKYMQQVKRMDKWKLSNDDLGVCPISSWMRPFSILCDCEKLRADAKAVENAHTAAIQFLKSQRKTDIKESELQMRPICQDLINRVEIFWETDLAYSHVEKLLDSVYGDSDDLPISSKNNRYSDSSSDDDC